MAFHYLFGPVASRRLGVSLGVDLVTHKVCSLDCLYCECGKTTDLTCARKSWVDFDTLIAELDQYWQENEDPDYITFSGSGEPTLNKDLGRVIAHIKKNKPHIKVAVLTNATLIHDPGVQADLMQADLVVPSLDAVSPEVFKKINRPCPSIDVETMIQGMAQFVRAFKGRVHLEIFILPGVNDSDQELGRFKQAIGMINPDLVQLNSLDRPGTEERIRPAHRCRLEEIKNFLGNDTIEIIAKVPKARASEKKRTKEELAHAILETIHRRPCTCEDLSAMLGADKDAVHALLSDFMDQGKIVSKQEKRGLFFQTIKGAP